MCNELRGRVGDGGYGVTGWNLNVDLAEAGFSGRSLIQPVDPSVFGVRYALRRRLLYCRAPLNCLWSIVPTVDIFWLERENKRRTDLLVERCDSLVQCP